MNTLVPREAGVAETTGRRRVVRIVVDVVLLLACSAALVVGGRAVVAGWANQQGDRALSRQDFVGAERWYRGNLVANWFEPWVAPYDVGVALYYQNNWAGAQAQFEQALPLAPATKRCIVAMNLAWSYEAEGDSLVKRGQPDVAADRWQRAKQVSAEAQCDEDSAASPESQVPKDREQSQDRNEGTPQEQQQRTEERVDKKLDEHQQEQQPPPPTSETQPDPRDQLAEDNTRAQSQQGQKHDQQSGTGKSEGQGEPTW